MTTRTTTRRNAPAPSPRRRYCTIAAAAEHLVVEPRTVRRLLADGKLTAFRVGTKIIRLDWAEVEALAVRVDPSDVSR